VTCREATEFLTGYVEGDLPPEQHALFERHISRCPNCRAFLEQYRNTIRAEIGSFAASDADARTMMPDELVRSIMDTIKGKV
jgi:anti-sigma factor RsiW